MNTNFLMVLITGIAVGGIAGYLGSLMLSRKMTIIVDPLSHLAFPGVALALIFEKNVSFFAFLFIFFGTILIWFLEEKVKLPTENLIAILFSGTLAITFLFLSEEETEEALIGDISKIGIAEGAIIILISILIFILVQKIYSKFLLISISEDLAVAEKINLKKYRFLYLLTISVIVALGVKFVGGLLVAGLTALPAATAKNLSKNLSSYRILSLFFGAISSIFGIYFYKITNLPAGSLIIVFSAILFLISVILKNRI